MESRIAGIKTRIEKAWEGSPRSAENIPRLMAVSKTRTAEELMAALESGADLIGENRIQELRQKQELLGEAWPAAKVELIGPLQTNKVKFLPGLVRRLQTLDREKLAHALEKTYGERGEVLPVLIQVNIDAEPQKAGLAADQVESFLAGFGRWPYLCCEGLMAIPKHRENPEEVRPSFRAMADLMSTLKGLDLPGNVSLEELSMGMSGDFDLAVEEGATLVRVGTALFGPRAAL